jgi:cardiolipin synthase A/B
MHTLIHTLQNLGWSLNGWTAFTLAAELLALLTIPSVLLQRRGQALSALAWILCLVGLPYFGVLFWWGIGRTHLERKRRKRRTARLTVTKGFVTLRPATEAEDGQIEFMAGFRFPEEDAGGIFPPCKGNRVRLLVDGEQTYAELEAMIREARHHVHCLFYIWERDAAGEHFRDLLAAKAREGVKVRVLLDAMGSGSASGRFMDPLRAAGGQVADFMPTRFLRRSLSINFRNHRKIVTVDGRIGYTGGLNIGDEYMAEWRDMGLRLEGPAVSQLQEVFLDDWYFATGENCADPAYFEGASEPAADAAGVPATCSILAGGPDTRDNPTLDTFFMGITMSRERVWITTPYLAPGPEVLTALRTAVYRGVDVRLLVPRRSDSRLVQLAGRSFYPALLAAGVRIYEYLPSVLHGKTWVFDREHLAIGSANLDNRSFKLNFEITCFLRSPEAAAQMAALFQSDLTRSEEITFASFEKRSTWSQLMESAANLLGPLL